MRKGYLNKAEIAKLEKIQDQLSDLLSGFGDGSKVDFEGVEGEAFDLLNDARNKVSSLVRWQKPLLRSSAA